MSSLRVGHSKRKRQNVQIEDVPTVIEVEARESASGSGGGEETGDSSRDATRSYTSCSSGSVSGDASESELFCQQAPVVLESRTARFGLVMGGGVYQRAFELSLASSETVAVPFAVVTDKFLPYLTVEPNRGMLEPGVTQTVLLTLDTAFLMGRVEIPLFLVLDGSGEPDVDQLPSFLVTARVMSRERGKPTLRAGVHCLVSTTENSSEPTEVQGFHTAGQDGHTSE